MNPFSWKTQKNKQLTDNVSSLSVNHKLVTVVSTNTKPTITKNGSSGRLLLNSEEKLKKNRRIINSFLKHVGHKVGKKLSLSPKGIEYFQYKQFVIVIEVPPAQADDDSTSTTSDCVFIYTMVFRLGDHHDRFAVLESCMELNYMKQATRGSTLGLNGDEVNLCYSTRVQSLNRETFVENLEDFMVTTSYVNQKLGLATSSR